MKKNKIHHIKDMFIAMSLSLSFGMIINILYFNIRGRYWFVFLNPLKRTMFETVDSATFSTIIYLLIGVFIWSIVWLYNTDKFGFTLTNFLHFIVSFVLFILLYLVSLLPYGNLFHMNLKTIKLIVPTTIAYFNSSFIFWDLVRPMLWIISSYLIIWGIFWIIQYRQVKKMNKEINIWKK